MTHYISVCEDAGTKATTALRVPLQDAVEHFPDMASPNKTDNTLLFGGYFDLPCAYSRSEGQDYMKMNVVLIDCDNGENNKPYTWDKDIIQKFKADMADYQYIIWETYSSTAERPKFRALIPIDGTLKYTKEVKQAVFKVFRDYADAHASWFFAPDTAHLPTVYHKSEGKLFSASCIERIADDMLTTRRLMDAEQQRRSAIRSILSPSSRNVDGWRNLPSVKKCLEGIYKGERDNSLCAACYAMDKNGYRSAIPQFLDECIVEDEFKRKFRRRYP